MDYYIARPPSVTRLAHIHAVNEVKLQVHWNTWLSERAIRSDLERGSTSPIPDAIITVEDNIRTAVEVELTMKKPDDLARKMLRLVNHWPISYRHVWFFVPNKNIQHAVETARSKLTEDQQERVYISSIEIDALPGLE